MSLPTVAPLLLVSMAVDSSIAVTLLLFNNSGTIITVGDGGNGLENGFRQPANTGTITVGVDGVGIKNGSGNAVSSISTINNGGTITVRANGITTQLAI